MPIQTPLLAVVPAGVLALVLLLAAWRPWKPGKPGGGWWASATVVGLGYLIADRLVWRSWPGLPPKEPHRWLPIIGLAGAAFGLLYPMWRGRLWRGYAMAGLAAAAMAPLLWVDLSRTTVLPWALVYLAIFTAAISMLFTELNTSAREVPGVRVPLVACIAGAGAALVTIQSHSASLGLTAASIAAAMGAIALVSAWRPSLDVAAAALPSYAVLLVGVLVANSETYVPAKICAILAAATAGIASRGPFRRLPRWAGTVIAVILTAALITAAIWCTPEKFNFGEGGEE